MPTLLIHCSGKIFFAIDVIFCKMGAYINKGNTAFADYLNGEYIDKTGMIAYINSTLNTGIRLTCVTRPRRFGKSLAANMLCAYYDKSCDSSALFDGFVIAKDPSYKIHLNKYPVIYIDITSFTTRYDGREDIVDIIQSKVMADVKKTYPSVAYDDEGDLMDTLLAISVNTGEKFVVIIDEWDALCRDYSSKPEVMARYVNLLRRMFKSSNDTAIAFAGVYMTGILPIKKYGTQSALNDFQEYSMTNSGPLGSFFGFDDDDVVMLAEKYGMDFDELKRWYDGYEMDAFDWRQNIPDIKKVAIYNPNSVMNAVRRRCCGNYWAMTEAFDSLQRYIDNDFNGVKDTLERLIKGEPVGINVLRFGNDMNNVSDNEELFNLLIHFGYLSYNPNLKQVVLPNQEIREEFVEAIRGSKSHKELSDLVRASDRLLEAVWNMDEVAVAEGVEYIHNHRVAPNFYNNEQSLRSVVRTAFLGAVDYYIEIQELATGKGFADIVYVPRRNSSKPLLVVELKWDKSASVAIDQIVERDYPKLLTNFSDKVLLVGINYSADTKKHECKIKLFR